MREILQSEKLPKTVYNYSPIVKAGPFYQTAGMVAVNEQKEIISGGLEAEMKHILKLLGSYFEAFSLARTDIVSVKVYVKDLAQMPTINVIWEDFFKGTEPPARTTIGVADLPIGAQIEMEFLFYKP